MMLDRPNLRRARPAAAGYRRRIRFSGSRKRIFDAIATLDGIRSWWTPVAGGSPLLGGELRLEFKGVDECIIMRVESAVTPRHVHWKCLLHTGLGEWEGTELVFDITELSAGKSQLAFRHIGLTPNLGCYSSCKQGWDHFLGSLVSYVQTGKGMPFMG